LKKQALKQKIDYNFDSIVDSTITIFSIIGLVSIFLNYLSHLCLNISGERQVKRIRYKFFESILRQDLGYFDQSSPGELSTIMNTNIDLIKMGINYKISDFLYFLCRGVGCLSLGILIAFKFTIVFLVLVPIMIFTSSFLGTKSKQYTKKELKSYESAGKLAVEALGSLRTVLALGIERVFIKKYSDELIESEKMSIKKGFLTGMLDGFSNLLFNGCFVIGLAYGVYLSRVDCATYTPSKIVSAFFSVMNCSFSFAEAMPFLKDLAEAKCAAFKVFQIIERKSLIDSAKIENKGKRLETLQGDICFNSVKFSYPSRQHMPILKGLSLNINAGKTVALVGSR
jgi:ATP-binding cassette subfamily B (MDR/TAP) protein 1